MKNKMTFTNNEIFSKIQNLTNNNIKILLKINLNKKVLG